MKRILAIFLLLLATSSINAYRIGDAIDTIAMSDSSAAQDVLRSQMPLFGRSSTAHFSHRQESSSRFSLSFEEGLRPIPWVNIENSKGLRLERVEVTFVYSRSGDGAIYGISSEPTYSNIGGDSFLVQYKWVEEEEVNLKAGGAVLLIVVLVACVAILISSCSRDMEDPKEEGQRGNTATYGGYAQAQSGVPKWD